jgi:hypothetical protein
MLPRVQARVGDHLGIERSPSGPGISASTTPAKISPTPLIAVIRQYFSDNAPLKWIELFPSPGNYRSIRTFTIDI